MQFCPCFLGSELPIDRGPLGIPAEFIGMQFLGKRGHIREAASQTLALQNTEFDFGHVQPTAMFGRVVEL